MRTMPDRSDGTTIRDSAVEPPTVGQVFIGFMTVGLCGFGGIFYWMRHILVDRRRWLTPEQFTEYLGLCSFLPGPNLVNLAVLVGKKFQGLRGALAAFAGLLCLPMAIAILLAALYARFEYLPVVRSVLAGLGAAAAGLVIATGLRMLTPLLKPRARWGLLVVTPVFLAVGMLRVPLLWALVLTAPLGIALAWWNNR
jgi:chromate transporter